MLHLIAASLCFILLVEFKYANGDIGTISGYPQVDIRELNPLTLSWNQVKKQGRQYSDASKVSCLFRRLFININFVKTYMRIGGNFHNISSFR